MESTKQRRREWRNYHFGEKSHEYGDRDLDRIIEYLWEQIIVCRKDLERRNGPAKKLTLSRLQAFESAYVWIINNI